MDEQALPRGDGPGTLHHVMNRGLAHRAAFEDEDDIRFFKSLLARQARDGRLRLQAFTFLTTHFHLLVESPRGELSHAMMLVESEYVRWFNKTRDRDGPLFRGRFTSRWVDTDPYWFILVRYIDNNAVQAGLVQDPMAYPHGSAWHYARSKGPIWLSRRKVEERVLEFSQLGSYRPEDYRRCFRVGLSEGERWIVERRFTEGAPNPNRPDPFRDLIGAAPESVRRWLCERARLADGTRLGQPVAAPSTVLELIQERRIARPTWRIPTGPRANLDAWQAMSVGLLRTVCGLRNREIAAWLAVGESTVTRCLRGSCRLLEQDPTYAAAAADLLAEALARSVAGNGMEPTRGQE
jgi:REP element-mobilizing transposase RayT